MQGPKPKTLRVTSAMICVCARVCVCLIQAPSQWAVKDVLRWRSSTPKSTWKSCHTGWHANAFLKLIPIPWYYIAFVTDALSTSFHNIHTICNLFTIYSPADLVFITPQRGIPPRIWGCPICMAGLPNTSHSEGGCHAPLKALLNSSALPTIVLIGASSSQESQPIWSLL